MIAYIIATAVQLVAIVVVWLKYRDAVRALRIEEDTSDRNSLRADREADEAKFWRRAHAQLRLDFERLKP
jgi:hypothetical protein